MNHLNVRVWDWAAYALRLKMFEERGAFSLDAVPPIDVIYRADGTRWSQPARRVR